MPVRTCDLCTNVNALGYKDAYTHATPFRLLRDVQACAFREAPPNRARGPATPTATPTTHRAPYSHPYNTQSPDGHPLVLRTGSMQIDYTSPSQAWSLQSTERRPGMRLPRGSP